MRVQVADAVLGTVCAGLLDQDWTEQEGNSAVELGLRALEEKTPSDEDRRRAASQPADRPGRVRIEQLTDEALIEEELLRGLGAWKDGEIEGAPRMADALALLRGPDGRRTWADGPTGRHRAALLEAVRDAAQSGAASEYRVPNVAGWLRAIGAPDPEGTAAELAAAAFDHLLHASPVRGEGTTAERRLNAAEAILATLPDDPRREARIEEAEHRPREALRLYRKAGADDDARRIIVDLALWDEADGVDEPRRGDQAWLLGIERAISKAPAEVGRRLGDDDRARLQIAVQELEKVTADAE